MYYSLMFEVYVLIDRQTDGQTDEQTDRQTKTVYNWVIENVHVTIYYLPSSVYLTDRQTDTQTHRQRSLNVHLAILSWQLLSDWVYLCLYYFGPLNVNVERH